MNENIFMSIYEIIKGWCTCGRIKNVEIIYHINDKHLECYYDFGVYQNKFDNKVIYLLIRLIHRTM